MRVDWSPQALGDLADAVLWYDEQCPGRGADLLALIGSSLEILREYPRAHPVVVGRSRRWPLVRYPFSLFYRLEPERIVVLALFHQSRHPRRWSGRVNEPLPGYVAA